MEASWSTKAVRDENGLAVKKWLLAASCVSCWSEGSKGEHMENYQDPRLPQTLRWSSFWPRILRRSSLAASYWPRLAALTLQGRGVDVPFLLSTRRMKHGQGARCCNVEGLH